MKGCAALVLSMILLHGCSEYTHEPTTTTPAAAETRSVARPERPNAADSVLVNGPGRWISQYIRRIFQDNLGHLWFATTNDGVVRYDGRSFTYFNAGNGFGSDWVSSVAQDASGALWFGTRDGVVRYDPSAGPPGAGGAAFARYTVRDGLPHDQVYCVIIDNRGHPWAATENGACHFDGKRFQPFNLPAADLSKHPYSAGPRRINWLLEDKSGHIWFASNGGGAYRYDPLAGKDTLVNIRMKDGLGDDFVQTMFVDREGALWFGTLHGGVSKYTSSAEGKGRLELVTTFGRQELRGEDVSVIHQDHNGTMWFGVTRVGLCSYNGRVFNFYNEKDGAGVRVVFGMMEDMDGQLWLGTGAGVYCVEDGRFKDWTKAIAMGSAQ